MRIAALLAALLALISCVPVPAAQDARVLLIGDSVLAYGRTRGEDVGTALSAALGEPVASRAVSGARVSSPAGRGLLGPDIARQDVSGGWDWIVLDGGANDLGAECGCGACEGVVEGLIGPDGAAGEIPALVSRLRATGARVIFVSYYGPSGLGGSFAACAGEFAEMARRAERMAARMEGVEHLPTTQLISAADISDYAPDLVHPSPRGAADIAGALAAIIRTGG